ncbi:MAG: efflux RND transporter permease subunit [Alphaproteobacteria bacterium]|nr:efflux RND transporter permease subunit [Alphaproteobacteria bacterium]
MPEFRFDSLKRLFLRPLLWILIYGGLAAYAAYAFVNIPVEVLPRFDFPEISVVTHISGATARQLETLVVRPLEGQLLSVADVVGIRSTMGNGVVENDVRFRSGTVPSQDLQAVNSAIDRARAGLPPGIEPYAEIMGNAINEVADYTVEIPPDVAPADVQRAIAARIVPQLRALPGVQRVTVYGTGDEALLISPNLAAMAHYGVGVGAIADAVKQHVVLGSAGYISLGHQDVLTETRGAPTRPEDLARIAVPGAHGPIPLAALAQVSRGPEPTHSAVLLDGNPSVAVAIFKQPGASTVPVTRAVQRTLDATLAQLPKGVRWVKMYDQGHLVGVIGADLGRNLLIGAVLAIAVLFWILGTGRGIWTLAFSIPLSLVLGVAWLYAVGQSLDLMTLGALTVAIGILADDAIIVLESIYHRWEQGDDRWTGIWNGVASIAGPDITGTLTIVAVFVPLLFVGGLASLFFVPFALAMSFALLMSLFVSLTFIPFGLGFIRAQPAHGQSTGGRAVERLRQRNARLLDLTMRFPWRSTAVCAVILLIGVGGLALVSVNFLPLPNEGVLLESFTLPPGSALTDTAAAVVGVTERLRKDPAVAHVFARIGSPESSAYTEPAYAGEIQIGLKPGVNVNSLDAIGTRLLRESRATGVQFALDTPTIERVGESLSGLPQPFVIHVFGADIATLRTLSEQVVARLRKVPALTDIFNNDAYPVTELQLEPKTDALAVYGLTPMALYDQLRPLLDGEVVATVPEGNYPLDFYVRLAEASDQSLAALRQLPIRTAGWTPLGQLANLALVTTPDQLRHIDGARALDILATPVGTPSSAIAATKRALAGLKIPAGYQIAFGGLYPELETAAVRLAVAALVAFALMAGILALQFEGWLVPGVLLVQIPLAFAGGALALDVSGAGLNASGLIAFVTLIGLSLRHGIVLLHYARRSEAEGMEPEAAVREAVHVRFRPILLTTLTAVLGMLPTALGWGQGAAPEQGLAIVILGGMLWSSLLSTNLLPALYLHGRRRQMRVARR